MSRSSSKFEPNPRVVVTTPASAFSRAVLISTSALVTPLLACPSVSSRTRSIVAPPRRARTYSHPLSQPALRFVAPAAWILRIFWQIARLSPTRSGSTTVHTESSYASTDSTSSGPSRSTSASAALIACLSGSPAIDPDRSITTLRFSGRRGGRGPPGASAWKVIRTSSVTGPLTGKTGGLHAYDTRTAVLLWSRGKAPRRDVPPAPPSVGSRKSFTVDNHGDLVRAIRARGKTGSSDYRAPPHDSQIKTAVDIMLLMPDHLP